MSSDLMKKSELIAAIARRSEQNSKDVQLVLKHFQAVILEEVKRVGEFTLLDLGKLKVSERAAREGMNPQSREKIVIPARKVPRLSPSRKFKVFVDTNGENQGEFNY